MLITGGTISILVSAMELDSQSRGYLVMGIGLLLCGSGFLFRKRTEKNEAEPDTFVEKQRDSNC